jgi:S1-C subfamily serine protease
MRKLVVWVIILFVILTVLSELKQNPSFLRNLSEQSSPNVSGTVKVISEESVVINVVKSVGPSVVTIAAQSSNQQPSFQQSPFFFFGPMPSIGNNSNEPQNIGSGFILSNDGFVVTNKHVVSDTGSTYTVITTTQKKYKVQKIYRDPLNDIAILKIDPAQNNEHLKPVELGDSSKLQVGQLAITIGTALGEFNNTVTTGVISGLGRGIVAGSAFEGYAERLDNVIQTDAAINPGNSGGPLLNSGGQVVGINTAVSQSGQNIGFALPINVVKESLQNFNKTGQFNRPYLGVSYQMVSRDAAIRNGLPEGAYVESVISGSVAEKAGLLSGDIITEVDGTKLQVGKTELATIVSKKKVGDTLKLTVWREDQSSNTGEGKTFDISVTLQAAPEQ